MSKWCFVLAKIFWNEMKNKFNKMKKYRQHILVIVPVINIPLPQMKISRNENSFPPFRQRCNRGKDFSFP